MVEKKKTILAKPLYCYGKVSVEAIGDIPKERQRVEFGERHCPELGVNDWRWVERELVG